MGLGRHGRGEPHPAGARQENPQFFGALSATAQGKFLPQTGAVVIKDKDGNVLGAAGASGGTGDEDEAVCIAGVEAAGLTTG